ncbi:SIMPL domain-containing protein [Gordonia sp. ABSL1-1]|uniref:SIMPL domain-containing protein n=1 Tax=Gordonia sp. ABSL1-1 TaxID=3053923 RepID=UPI0025728DC9|nr:SIMPL domain-containing protein [Gordonia sp. ABSL1-1]MDL9938953.1 SIMPL domain-containing protein [Gordonia sp. ABSL1-1]
MSDQSQLLQIVVRGTARDRYRAERAVVELGVHLEDADKATVYSRAVGVHAELTTALGRLRDAGAVTRWSSDSVRVYSYRPSNAAGKRLDPVYTTRIRVDGEFVDFEKMSAFLDRWAGVEGIDVGDVSWDVTEENRRGYERELRARAVADAVAKAQAYADAVARGPVVATELADPDMLNHQPPQPMMMRAMAVADASGSALELRPDDVEIAVAVDARFVAGTANPL